MVNIVQGLQMSPIVSPVMTWTRSLLGHLQCLAIIKFVASFLWRITQYTVMTTFHSETQIIPSEYMVLRKPTTCNCTERRLYLFHSRSFTRITHRASLHTEDSRQSHSFSPPRSHNTFSDFKKDKVHCLQRRVPHTGPMHLLNRSSKFHQVTSVCHATYVAFLLLNELTMKPALSGPGG